MLKLYLMIREYRSLSGPSGEVMQMRSPQVIPPRNDLIQEDPFCSCDKYTAFQCVVHKEFTLLCCIRRRHLVLQLN